MEDLICSRIARAPDWKQKGFLTAPTSRRQRTLAIASKEYIERLGCYSEVRRLLALGKRPRDVSVFIQQHNEFPILTFNSIKKYAQVYRRFFIPAVETLQNRAEELGAGDLAIRKGRLDVLAKGFGEIGQLEEMIRLQSERIRRQVRNEEQLGLPLPGMRLEIETQLKLISALLEKKIELGLYSRATQESTPPAVMSLIARLSPDERKRMAEVGCRILDIIDAARSNSSSG